LALVQLGKDTLGREKAKGALAAWEVAVAVPPEVARRRTVSILIWTIGFFIAIWLLGFAYSIPVAMLLYLKFAGKEKWPMAIAVTFFTWLFIYALFERTLSIPFPEGLLVSLIKADNDSRGAGIRRVTKDQLGELARSARHTLSGVNGKS